MDRAREWPVIRPVGVDEGQLAPAVTIPISGEGNLSGQGDSNSRTGLAAIIAGITVLQLEYREGKHADDERSTSPAEISPDRPGNQLEHAVCPNPALSSFPMLLSLLAGATALWTGAGTPLTTYRRRLLAFSPRAIADLEE